MANPSRTYSIRRPARQSTYPGTRLDPFFSVTFELSRDDPWATVPAGNFYAVLAGYHNREHPFVNQDVVGRTVAYARRNKTVPGIQYTFDFAAVEFARFAKGYYFFIVEIWFANSAGDRTRCARFSTEHNRIYVYPLDAQ
jgi:hypothetical protein